jgi:hypothetical protein
MKRETAPAHLLKQSNDEDRREQSYTNAQPVCVDLEIRRGCPSCDREGSHASSPVSVFVSFATVQEGS